MKFSTALSLLLAAATHSARGADDPVCAEGTYAGNGHYYKVFKFPKGTKEWFEIQNGDDQHCGAEGYLVNIERLYGSPFGECMWPHTGELANWTNWCAGQPDKSGGFQTSGEVWVEHSTNPNATNPKACWNDRKMTEHKTDEVDKYIYEYDCTRPSVSGDPHFKTWTGQKFDFHGGCDLVLLQNANFLNGLGLHVHVRTQIKTWWSFIESAVVRLGDKTLEIAGTTEEGKIRYWLNGEEVEDMETGDAALGDYSVHFRRKNAHQSTTRIDLGNNNAMSIETFKDFVRVNIKADDPEKFNGSYGMLGAYPSGEQVGRDKKTVISDPNEFGFEWQVQPSEPNLFHSNSPVAHPLKCAMPEDNQESKARRLGESMITEEEAATACARVASEYRDACVFDVMATNDKDLAGSY